VAVSLEEGASRLTQVVELTELVRHAGQSLGDSFEECEAWGWFARLVPGKGWVRCKKDDRDASPDLNRLDKDARWDRANKKWVRRTSIGSKDQGKVE
jgi:hypothetical protein